MRPGRAALGTLGHVAQAEGKASVRRGRCASLQARHVHVEAGINRGTNKCVVAISFIISLL